MKKILKIEYLFLFFILLLAALLRFYKIDAPLADWHSWRQADTASVTRFFVQDGIDLLRPRYHDLSSTATGYENPQGFRFVEFPVFNAIHAILYKTFPAWSFERWGRLTSILSSLVSLVLLYFVGKRFLGTAGGLLAGLFFAILPYNIYFSRVILPEPLAVAAVLASIWFFVLWIDKERYFFLLLSALLFALSMLIKPFTIFYAVPMLYLAITKFGILGALREAKLWTFVSVIFIPLFAWRAWIGHDYYFVGIPHWLWAFNGDLIRFKPSFWWWIFEERLGRLILGTWALVPFVFGLLYRSGRGFPWFLHSMLLGQFLYVSVIATASVRHDYYQTLVIPTVALLLGAGALLLWNLRGLNTVLLRFMVVGTITAGLSFSFYQVKEFYKINHPEIIRAGAAVDKLTPKDALIIAPYNGDTAFLYQTNRRGWPFVTLPLEKMINRLGAQYYVSVNFDKQTQEVIEKYQVLEKTNEYVIVKLQ